MIYPPRKKNCQSPIPPLFHNNLKFIERNTLKKSFFNQKSIQSASKQQEIGYSILIKNRPNFNSNWPRSQKNQDFNQKSIQPIDQLHYLLPNKKTPFFNQKSIQKQSKNTMFNQKSIQPIDQLHYSLPNKKTPFFNQKSIRNQF